jgi:hypothetical protein
MIGSTLLRAGTLVTSLGLAPLALAQDAATQPPWGFVGVLGGMAMLMAFGIIAIVFFNDSRKSRDKLGLIERLVTSGQPVPRELMVNEPRQLTLPEQYRHDVRRAIAFLGWASASAWCSTSCREAIHARPLGVCCSSSRASATS